MGFELFSRRVAALTKEPIATVQKSGTIGLNAAAHEMIDQAMMVEFLFNRQRNVLALRPVDDSPHGYKLRKPSETGYTSVFAAALFDAYEIDVSESRRFVPFIENGMLCIDLAGSYTPAGRSSQSPDASED